MLGCTAVAEVEVEAVEGRDLVLGVRALVVDLHRERARQSEHQDRQKYVRDCLVCAEFARQGGRAGPAWRRTHTALNSIVLCKMTLDERAVAHCVAQVGMVVVWS